MIRRLVGVVVVALVAVGGAASAEAPTRTISMPGKLFTPDRLDVLVGTTVSWKNDDAVNHTATAENDAFASGYIPPGGSYGLWASKKLMKRKKGSRCDSNQAMLASAMVSARQVS